MKGTRKASMNFTGLIVDDEEAQAEYYHQVYGLNKLQRLQGDQGGEDGTYREIVMGPGETVSSETLVMFKFIDRPAPRDQEVILGFTTEDLDALADRILAHGGKHVGSIKSMPEHGVRVLFSTDPENRLCENVEIMVD